MRPILSILSALLSVLVLSAPSLVWSLTVGKNQPMTPPEIMSLSERNEGIHSGLLGRKFIQIDDMRFYTDALQIQGFDGPKWVGGRLPIAFHPDVTEEHQDRFHSACQEWGKVARITCVARRPKFDRDFVLVIDDTSNYSYVGRQFGGQTLGIVSWGSPFIIAHEIGHALGVVHEQQRSDRDEYVKINFNNIDPDAEHNFDKHGDLHFSTYDFDSVMHYDDWAFSNGEGPTIDPLPEYESNRDLMGQRDHLSTLDGTGMAKRYGELNPSPQYCHGKKLPRLDPECLYECQENGWFICGCGSMPMCP